MSGYEITKIIHKKKKRILSYNKEYICEIVVFPRQLICDQLFIINNDHILYDMHKYSNTNLCCIKINKETDYSIHETIRITNPNIIQSLAELYELYHDENASADQFADMINLLFNYRSNFIKLLDEVKLQDFSNVKNAKLI